MADYATTPTGEYQDDPPEPLCACCRERPTVRLWSDITTDTGVELIGVCDECYDVAQADEHGRPYIPEAQEREEADALLYDPPALPDQSDSVRNDTDSTDDIPL